LTNEKAIAFKCWFTFILATRLYRVCSCTVRRLAHS